MTTLRTGNTRRKKKMLRPFRYSSCKVAMRAVHRQMALMKKWYAAEAWSRAFRQTLEEAGIPMQTRIVDLPGIQEQINAARLKMIEGTIR